MSLRYFPLEDRDFRLKMGLQALNGSWLDPDRDHLREIAEKRRLLEISREAVFGEIPGTVQAQNTVLDMVRMELSSKNPGMLEQPQEFTDDSPLVRAATLVQEDLVLMRRQEEDYVLAAACVCFPSGWNLVEKVGRPMQAIHQPVPGLNAGIGAPIDRFFRKLKPGKTVERCNWGLYDSNVLFQPGHWRDSRGTDETITAANVGERLFFRVERQTLQRLGDTPDVLFTIRIYNSPLAEVTENPERARRLRRTLETMPDGMQKYKSVTRYAPLIREFVETACRD